LSTPYSNQYILNNFCYLEFIEDFYPWGKQDPTLYEGDIQLFGDKNAILDNSYRWPNAIIPYEIADDYSKSVFLILSNFVSRRVIITIYFPLKSS
jgi:hypothetical protein